MKFISWRWRFANWISKGALAEMHLRAERWKQKCIQAESTVVATDVAALVEAAQKVADRFLPTKAALIFSKRNAIDGLIAALSKFKEVK